MEGATYHPLPTLGMYPLWEGVGSLFPCVSPLCESCFFSWGWLIGVCVYWERGFCGLLFGRGSIDVSWGVGRRSVDLSPWKRLFYSRVGENLGLTPGRGHSRVCFLGDRVCVSVTLRSLHVCLLVGGGVCTSVYLYVCLLGQKGQGRLKSFFLQQPLSAQPWEVLPPACRAQPRALRHCGRPERVPAPWRRAPLAAAMRSAAPPAVSGVYAAAAHADAESFLPYSREVKEP